MQEGIYFLRSMNTGLVKVGRSRNTEVRVKAFGRRNKVLAILQLNGKEHGSLPAHPEKLFHGYFASHRVRGEWFDLTDKQVKQSLRLWNRDPKLLLPASTFPPVTVQLGTLQKYQHTCQRSRCGHQWISGMKNPKSCPRCRSYVWQVKTVG
jgi:hypothetical protein